MTAVTMDATQRIKSLIALTEELTAVFERENASLAARRPREIAALQGDKARLAAAYAQSIRAIAADRSLVSGACASLMETLRSLTQRFEQRADAQRSLLDGARLASEGVVNAIAEEAAAAAAGPAYGAPGEKSPAPSAAVAFDRKA